MRFDVTRALTMAQAFNFPRPSGSEGEGRAAELIAREFEKAGWFVEQTPVRPRSRFSTVVATALFTLLFFALLWTAVRRTFPQWTRPTRVAVVVSLFVASAGLVASAGGRRGMRRLQDRFFTPRRLLDPDGDAVNIVAQRPHESRPPTRVLVVSHLVTLPPRRPWAFWVALFLVLFLAVSPRFGVARHWVEWGIIGFIVVTSVWAMRSWVKERPPFPGDNRSGLAFLMELAHALPPRLHEGVEVHLAAVAGVGGDRWGALHLAENVRHRWPRKPTLVVNVDSPGLGKHVVIYGWGDALAMAQKAARDLWLPHRAARWPLSLCLLDHRPFAACGIPALSLAGDRDAREIDPSVLTANAQLVAELALRWSKRAAEGQEGASLAKSSQKPG